MSRYLRPLFGSLFFCAGVIALAVVGLTLGSPVAQGVKTPALSTVLVDLKDGLGAGVYIGNHHILTAGHVVSEVLGTGKSSQRKGWKKADLPTTSAINIVAENGSEGPGRVEWVDKDYDVAMLTFDGTGIMEASDLACRKPILRENIEVVGNPLGFRFVHTFGQVAQPKPVAPHDFEMKSYFMADVMAAPGNSGGPVFDQAGKVLGLVDAIMAVPVGFTPSLMPLTFVVPSLTICELIKQHQ